MAEALGWLGQIISWFGQWVPRWTIVNTTEAGVKWVKGDTVVPFGPGIVWHWPVTTEMKVLPVARQALDLRAQTLTTSDDVPILASAIVTYRIVDVEKALSSTWNLDELVRDSSMTAVHRVLERLSWADIHKAGQSGDLDKQLRREARRVLEPYGVRCMKLNLVDRAKTRVVKLAISTDTVL